jgi:hypothetical protein
MRGHIIIAGSTKTGMFRITNPDIKGFLTFEALLALFVLTGLLHLAFAQQHALFALWNSSLLRQQQQNALRFAKHALISALLPGPSAESSQTVSLDFTEDQQTVRARCHILTPSAPQKSVQPKYEYLNCKLSTVFPPRNGSGDPAGSQTNSSKTTSLLIWKPPN